MATDMEQVNFRVPPGWSEKITAMAKERGVGVSEFIRQALERSGIQMPEVPGRGRPARPEWAKGQRVILAVPPHMLGEDFEAVIDEVTRDTVIVGDAVFRRQPNGAWKTGSVGGFRTLRRVDG